MGAAEELFDFADVGGAGVGGEALDEDFAVLFFEDAIVEQDEQATVVEGADEASEALLEGDDGGGDGVVEERVAAGSSSMARPRAWTMGSLGTAKGILSMMTQLSCSPWTSTPCQKDEVAKRTALGVERNCSMSAVLGAEPCKSMG